MNAVHNIHTHLNLNGNEVRNVRLEGLPSDPDPVEGGMYFNLETGEFRFSDGTAWKSLLGGFWKIDDDGNLVTDRNVIIKNNLIVTKDTSTGSKGTDQGVSGTVTGIRVDANTILEPTNGIVDMSDVLANLEVDVDLSDYYTKQETLAEIAKAIPSLDGYATEKYVTDAITALNVGQYAKASDLTTLQTEVDNIEAVLGMDEEAAGIINTWNEVKEFLDGYSSSDDLAAILSGMNADIATRALDSDLTALSNRVATAEANITALGNTKADKATTLAGYGITDAYTKTEVATELAKYILKEAESQTIKGDLIIEGNLIVTKDTSSGGTGGDAGASGTVIGVVVNGTSYDDETNGMLDLSTLMNQYVTSEWITSQRFVTTSHLASTIGPLSGRVETLEKAGYITSSALNGYATQSWVESKGYITGITLTGDDYISVNGYKLSLAIDAQGGLENTGQGLGVGNLRHKLTFGSKSFDGGADKTITASDLGLGNVENKSSATIRGEITSANVTNALGYTPLSTAGGTISGTTATPLIINSSLTTSVIGFKSSNVDKSYIGYSPARGIHLYNYAANVYFGVKDDGTPFYNDKTLYHTGNFNPADYLPKSGGTIAGTTFRPLIVDTSYTEITEIGIGNKGTIYSGFGYNNGFTFIGREDGGNFPKIAIRHSDGAPVYSPNNLTTTYTLIHSGNYATQIGDYYLKSSGGTMTGELCVQSASTDSSAYIAFKQGTNAKAYLLYSGGDDFNFYSEGWAKKYTFIHSGNIGSQSVASLIPQYVSNLDSATSGGVFTSGFQATNRPASNYSTGLTLYNTELKYYYQLAFDTTGGLYARYKTTTAWEAWKTIAFTDSDITGNAAKLKSPSGLGYANADGSDVLFGYTTSQAAINTYLDGYNLYLRYGTGHATGLILNTSGNVLIGTTTDSGEKLQVIGSASFGSATSWQNERAVLNYAGLKLYARNTGGYNQSISFLNYDGTLFAGLFAYERRGLVVGTSQYDPWVTFTSDGVHINGNLIVSSDTATGSDIRFKDIKEYFVFDLETMANAPLFAFTWNDRNDNEVHIGGSAQYWQDVRKELVRGEDFLSMNYTAVNYGMGVSLAKTTLNHEERIKILENKIEALEAENRRLRYGS